jgi:3-methylcrotonyl-CoA carboxylase alpha subunit
MNTNIEFLKKVISHPEFIKGDVETGFIQKNYAQLFPPLSLPNPLLPAIAALSILDKELTKSLNLNSGKYSSFTLDPHSPFTSLESFRVNNSLVKPINLEYGSFKLEVQVTFNPDSLSLSVVDLEGKNRNVLATYPKVSIEKTAENVSLKGIINGTRISSNVVHVADKIHVFYNVRIKCNL